MLSNAKVADGSESSRAAKEGTVVPAATSTGMRLQASLLVKHINHLVEKTFASFTIVSPSRQITLDHGSSENPKSRQQQSLGKIYDVVMLSRLKRETI